MKKIQNKKMILLLLMGVIGLLVLSGCTMTQPDDTVGLNNNIVPPAFEVYTTPPPTQVPTQAPATEAPQTNVPPANTGTGLQGNSDLFGNTPVQSPQNTGGIGVLPTTSPSLQTAPTASRQTVPTSSPRPTITAKPTASPSPTPSSFRKGSTGAGVKSMQQKLKDLGYYKGSVDGDFGTGTVDAVKAFQKQNGLRVDGIAGKGTLDLLNSSKAKKYTATASPKPTASPTPKPVTINPDKARYLKVENNMSGKDVTQLQSRLISLGYLTGKTDGKYGYRTEAAVKAFQKRNGLWDDGIAGPDTQVTAQSSGAKKANSVVAHIGDSLKQGAKGNGVRAMQKKLADLGYLKSGEADGTYGANTAAAISSFQRNNGLSPVDGIAGSNTLEKIYSPSAVKSDGSGGGDSSGGGSSTSVDGVLRPGDSGAAVRKLQDKLKKDGYLSGSSDGTYGGDTEDAVKKFQFINGLKVDGKAGPATQRLLYGDTGITPEKYNPLKLHDEGEAVKTLQYALYELGYFQGKIRSIYNEDTKNAVKEFQGNNGLKVDGVAGSTTIATLFSSYAKPASKTTSNFKKLEVGSRGDDVYVLENRLEELNYFYSGFVADTYYDKDTRDAVKAFQKRNGLTQDGIAGTNTQEKLFSSSAVPSN
ncbi:MAG: hypothetical protein GX786_07310 [Clostridiales bacterium]|nr:hypothetical protein [Clostridiales bacterium]